MRKKLVSDHHAKRVLNSSSSDSRKSLFLLFSNEAAPPEECIEAALQAGDPAVPWLIHWLVDQEERVETLSMEALKRSSSPLVEQELSKRILALCEQASRQVSNSGDDYYKVLKHIERMMTILQTKPSEYAAQTFITLIKSPVVEISSQAIMAVKSMQDMSAADTLVEALIEKESVSPYRNLTNLEFRSPTILIAMVWAGIGGVLSLIFLTMWLISGFVDSEALIATGIFGFTAVCSWFLGLFLRRNSLRRFRQVSVDALTVLQSPKAIGPLLHCMRDPRLFQAARNALEPLLRDLTEESTPALTPEQIRTLRNLSIIQEKNFQSESFNRASPRFEEVVLRSLPLLGDEETLIFVEQYAQYEGIPMELRSLASEILPALQQGVEKRSHRKTLLRAASQDQENQTLLRAADQVQNEIPNEQLMRSQE
ncbi:MAG: hypothetical protein KIT45_13350 [Fimbriimonadia bacterium]|nr:hypothetical protein [Fimbriimonadia bacterium]